MLGGALALCWPALDNGYPLTFQDTAWYLTAIHGGSPHPVRTIGYWLFADWTTVGPTLWTVVAAQALLTSLLLVRAADLWAGGGRRGVALAALGLASVLLLSSAAKYVSWIMADVTTPWIFLAGLVLVISERWLDRVAAFGILALATLTHASHPPLVASMAIGSGLVGAWWLRVGDPRRRRVVLLPVWGLLLVLWVPVANRLAGLEAAFVPGATAAGILYRFIDTGVASKTLDIYCDERDWVSCDHREEYARHIGRSDGWFLFDPRSPFHTSMGGWEAREPGEIVAHALRCCLADIAWTSAVGTWDQLWRIDSRDGLAPIDTEPARYWLRSMGWSSDLRALVESRQAVGAEVRVKLNPLPDRLLQALLFAATVALLVAEGARRAGGRGAPASGDWLLLAGVLGFLVANAAICSIASTTHDRYQGRVAWLLPYALTLYLYGRAVAASAPEATGD